MAAFFCTFRAKRRAGSAAGMPSNTLSRPFSAFLICSQLAHHLVGAVDLDVAEHVRVAAHELVVHAAGHVGQRELPLLGGEGGVEHHLEQQVAELLLEVLVARRRPRRRGASMASSTS